jgi:hypothetical protein
MIVWALWLLCRRIRGRRCRAVLGCRSCSHWMLVSGWVGEQYLGFRMRTVLSSQWGLDLLLVLLSTVRCHDGVLVEGDS